MSIILSIVNMINYMKQSFLNSVKIAALALIIGLGVSYVSAFTPGTQVPAVINTSVNDQIKDGGIFSEKWFASDLSFFTKTLLPGTDSWMNIGGGNSTVTPDMISNNGSTIPLTIDLKDRAKTTKTVAGQNAINFISGQSTCATATALINDRAPAFEFTSGGNNADLIARQLQLQGGTPRDNSVLAAIDNNGNAVWAKLVVEGGVLKVIDNKTGLPIPGAGITSPVVIDSDCTPPPAITYSWSTGVWGTCDGHGLNDWVDYSPKSPYKRTINLQASTWLSDTNGFYSSGIQTRNVTCKDSNGNTVADSLCTTTKPDSNQSCPISLQYRVSASSTVVNSQTNAGYALYAKDDRPNGFNIWNDDCKAVKISDPVPVGYYPIHTCSILPTSGGNLCVGFGFSAGNPSTCTFDNIETLYFKLQVKKQ